jgi:hypothetical protein
MIQVKVNINVDFDNMIEEIEEVVATGMRDLMMAAYGEWQDAVERSKLNTTKSDYKDAIQHRIVDDMTVQLFLSHNDKKKNWLINALELGHGPMLPWRSTLAKRKAFYWSPWAKWPNKYKWHSYAEGYKGPSDSKPRSARKPPNGYKPFMDVPNWGKGTARRGQTPTPSGGKPPYARLTAASSGKWTHKGFRPIGDGGLETPLREEVVEFVKEEAPRMLHKLIQQVVKG